MNVLHTHSLTVFRNTACSCRRLAKLMVRLHLVTNVVWKRKKVQVDSIAQRHAPMCVAFGCDFFCCASNLLNAERSVRSQTAAANIFFIANIALRASCRALTINRISNSRPVIYSSAAVVCRHIFVTMCMPVANRNESFNRMLWLWHGGHCL